MKKLSLLTLAISAFLFISSTATAQSRNMQKRGADNSNGQYNQQGSGQYGGNQNDQRNGQYNSGNSNEQYGQGNEYGRGNEQYGRGEDNRRSNEQYGRREDSRRGGFRIVVSNRGRYNDWDRDNERRRAYERSCNSRSYHRY